MSLSRKEAFARFQFWILHEILHDGYNLVHKAYLSGFLNERLKNIFWNLLDIVTQKIRIPCLHFYIKNTNI